MVVADTNVCARSYLNNDTAQTQKARQALAEARSAVMMTDHCALITSLCNPETTPGTAA